MFTAGALGKSGELFALDMGEPVKIVDLPCDLIRLSGLEEGVDVDISFCRRLQPWRSRQTIRFSPQW